MRSYTALRAAPASSGKAVLTDPVWDRAESATIDVYPWYQKGNRQATTAKLLYDSEALHVLFIARDRYSSAEPRELNGSVCRDSCVEFFAVPFPEENLTYFNLEINCCGALHLGWGENIGTRSLVDAVTARAITVVSTFDTPTKNECPDDSEWRIYARLPYSVIAKLAGRAIVTSHDWRCNFYRCGGNTDPQYACWNHIEWEHPAFHKPEFFGPLHFGGAEPAQ